MAVVTKRLIITHLTGHKAPSLIMYIPASVAKSHPPSIHRVERSTPINEGMANTDEIRVRLPCTTKKVEKLNANECAPPVYISYEKDDDYYFSWLVFLVGERLFNVPRHYFEQSTIFIDMFNLPSGKKIDEGTSVYHPIELKNVSVGDFKAFLKLLIPRPGHESDEITRAEWLGVLSLSNMWNFKELRELAITKLTTEKMQAAERILLGYKYEIWDWLVYSHAHLVARKRFLSVEEARKLGGLTFAINMGLAREKKYLIFLRPSSDELQ